MDQQELNKIIGLSIDVAQKMVGDTYHLCPFSYNGKFLYSNCNNFNNNPSLVFVEINSNVITRILTVNENK